MFKGKKYPFVAMDSKLGETASLQPYLPLNLSYQQNAIKTSGLLDTRCNG